MGNYAAKANADGSLVMGSDGKRVKGDLLRIFVMGKGEIWAHKTIPELKKETRGLRRLRRRRQSGRRSDGQLATPALCRSPCPRRGM